jgi:hypothetical protein
MVRKICQRRLKNQTYSEPKIAGTAESSFVSKRLQLAGASKPALHSQEEDELMHAAGTMYTAGSETVSTNFEKTVTRNRYTHPNFVDGSDFACFHNHNGTISRDPVST